MSHFSVFVLGDDVEKQLAPYHEFECTGRDDEYVQDVDITTKARAEWGDSTETRLKAPDGTLHTFFDEKGEWRPEFSKPDATPYLGVPQRTRFVPPGYEQIELPTPEVMSFVEWVAGWYGLRVLSTNSPLDRENAHKFGYIRVVNAGTPSEEVTVIDRTNPNSHWDWWEIGGRWSGFLKLKPGRVGQSGKKGVMGSCFAEGADRADVAKKRDIDFDGMRNQAGEKAAAEWDKAAAARGVDTWESWAVVRSRHEGAIDAACAEYNGNPIVQRVSTAMHNPWDGIDEFLVPRDQYIAEARDAAIAPFAMVMDGQWAEKGRMGWFGVAHNEESQAQWNQKVSAAIDALDDDTTITVVDCHI